MGNISFIVTPDLYGDIKDQAIMDKILIYISKIKIDFIYMMQLQHQQIHEDSLKMILRQIYLLSGKQLSQQIRFIYITNQYQSGFGYPGRFDEDNQSYYVYGGNSVTREALTSDKQTVKIVNELMAVPPYIHLPHLINENVFILSTELPDLLNSYHTGEKFGKLDFISWKNKWKEGRNMLNLLPRQLDEENDKLVDMLFHNYIKARENLDEINANNSVENQPVLRCTSIRCKKELCHAPCKCLKNIEDTKEPVWLQNCLVFKDAQCIKCQCPIKRHEYILHYTEKSANVGQNIQKLKIDLGNTIDIFILFAVQMKRFSATDFENKSKLFLKRSKRTKQIGKYINEFTNQISTKSVEWKSKVLRVEDVIFVIDQLHEVKQPDNGFQDLLLCYKQRLKIRYCKE